MRELPEFQLVQVHLDGAALPSNYLLKSTQPAIEGFVLGQVRKDRELAHSGLSWHGWVSLPAHETLDLGFFRTRQSAVLEVAKVWQRVQDEWEAHRLHKLHFTSEPEPEPMTSLDWELRVKELAEELGRAQAHAIPNSGLHYRRVDDGELLEETVFAARSLRRQRDKVPFNADALRTAAFAYQFAMNASHQRALADVKHHTQAVVFTAGMREVENVWES